MNMQLTTGTIYMSNGVYGIENLKKIVRSIITFTDVVKNIKRNPPPSNFLLKIGYWIGSLFKNKDEIYNISKDLVQIAANTELICHELRDLTLPEISALLAEISPLIGRDKAQAFLNELPKLLESLMNILKVV